MKIVNQNKKFRLISDLNYDGIIKRLINHSKIKIYRGRPTMLRYKDLGCCMLLFTTLNGRLMGNGEHQDLLLTQFCKLTFSRIGNITLQSLTIVHDMEQLINLNLLPPQFTYEPELFCAASINLDKVHVNIFHTGKIILLGIKSTHDAEYLYQTSLLPALEKCLVK